MLVLRSDIMSLTVSRQSPLGVVGWYWVYPLPYPLLFVPPLPDVLPLPSSPLPPIVDRPLVVAGRLGLRVGKWFIFSVDAAFSAGVGSLMWINVTVFSCGGRICVVSVSVEFLLDDSVSSFNRIFKRLLDMEFGTGLAS